MWNAPRLITRATVPYDTRGYVERAFYTSYTDDTDPPVIFAHGDQHHGDATTVELVARVGHCTGYARKSPVIFLCAVSANKNQCIVSEAFRCARRKPPHVHDLPDPGDSILTPALFPLGIDEMLFCCVLSLLLFHLVRQALSDQVWGYSRFKYVPPEIKRKSKLDTEPGASLLSATASTEEDIDEDMDVDDMGEEEEDPQPKRKRSRTVVGDLAI